MKHPTVTFYRDSKGEYRWRLRARNGRIVADCGEGYKTRRGAENGYLVAREVVREATVIEDYEAA